MKGLGHCNRRIQKDTGFEKEEVIHGIKMIVPRGWGLAWRIPSSPRVAGMKSLGMRYREERGRGRDSSRENT